MGRIVGGWEEQIGRIVGDRRSLLKIGWIGEIAGGICSSVFTAL